MILSLMIRGDEMAKTTRTAPVFPRWLKVTVREAGEVVLSFGSVEEIMTADMAVNVALKLVRAARASDVLRGVRLASTDLMTRSDKDKGDLDDDHPSL